MHRLAALFALAAALIGGICWVANLFVDSEALSWAGSLLLAAAAGLVGARLAKMVWLAAIAGVGTAVLCWSLAELARRLAEVRVVEGVLGAGAALVVGIAMALPARVDDGRSEVRHASARSAGNHRG
ncbi:hypothetical protein BH09ACT12_BH09ACT12_37250 [soil metagenome]